MSAEHLPCGDSANESERIAIEHLLVKLRGHVPKQRWLVLSNVPSAVNDRAIPDEIDLVCIGPAGFFVIEVKHWDKAYLKSNQTVVLKEATKLNDKIRRVVSKLRRSGVDPGFVAGRFLLTKEGVSWSDQQRPEFHGCKFYGLSDWKQLVDVDGGAIFADAAIRQACQAIQPLSKVALHGDIRRIADVRNLELQSPREDRFHRVYRGEHIRTRDKVILHLYDLSADNEAKPDRLASRDFEALQKLQHLPCVPRLMDSFHEVSEYPGELCYFSLVDPCAPTVSERLADNRWTIAARRKFAARALKALAQIHNTERDGVAFVHRRIGPKTLLVGADNQPVFTGFDLSRISGTQTVSAGAIIEEDAAWVAPEVKSKGFAVADQRSDVFSLCATLKLLFENKHDTAAEETIAALWPGMAETPDQRPSLNSLASGFDDAPYAPTTPALPSARYWSEGREVVLNQKTFRIVSRLGSGSHGTTFKVLELDGDREVGCFAAKVVFDKTGGERAHKAFRSARLPSGEWLYLATIFETSPQFCTLGEL